MGKRKTIHFDNSFLGSGFEGKILFDEDDDEQSFNSDSQDSQYRTMLITIQRNRDIKMLTRKDESRMERWEFLNHPKLITRMLIKFASQKMHLRHAEEEIKFFPCNQGFRIVPHCPNLS